MCPKPKIEKTPEQPDEPLAPPDSPVDADLQKEENAFSALRQRAARSTLRIQTAGTSPMFRIPT